MIGEILMKLYMVRRTRSFIKTHYAQDDKGRKFLEYQVREYLCRKSN